MTAADHWLSAMWPVVRGRLPEPPRRVVEIGCGPQGGFVPKLRAGGYEAVGVDPRAPEGEEYRRAEFEHAEPFEGVDIVVASTSLHHVADPVEVIDRIASTFAPRGTLVVVEWAWEDFDEATARWCFERLGPDEEAGWLHRRRDAWAASQLPWDVFFREWAESEGLHTAETLVRLLDARFDRAHVARGPYFFSDLGETTEAEERAAIDAGLIRATRVDYVGRLR